jgi:hypothetical protein
MSSVTTSTTEWPPADQPSSTALGVVTRRRAVPWGAGAGEVVVGSQGAVQVGIGASTDVLARDMSEVVVEELAHHLGR